MSGRPGGSGLLGLAWGWVYSGGMDPTVAELPLFPLGTVLFQGGSLQLQIFEPRYLDMVSRCMRDGVPFGVVLIRQGSDTWQPGSQGPDLFEIGTAARIVDFNQLGNGRKSNTPPTCCAGCSMNCE